MMEGLGLSLESSLRLAVKTMRSKRQRYCSRDEIDKEYERAETIRLRKEKENREAKEGTE